jgi:hypothetical protein
MDSIECFLLAPATLAAQFEEFFDKLFGGTVLYTISLLGTGPKTLRTE